MALEHKIITIPPCPRLPCLPLCSRQFCLTFVSLMALATEGRNHMTEKQCHSVLPETDIAEAIASIDGTKLPHVQVSCADGAVGVLVGAVLVTAG